MKINTYINANKAAKRCQLKIRGCKLRNGVNW